MLELKNVKRYYKTSDVVTKALDDVSISFRDSEFVSVLGPSGSGKTTMLNVIGGLDHYTDGDLLINGVSTKDFWGKDWDSYRNNEVGFIFQGYNLIPHQTILSNVEIALTLSGIRAKERKKRAMKALEEVGLKDQAKKYPKQLSGGQQQRVSIARALVNNPSIVFADEPTGALDTKTSVEIMELLKKVSKDKLVVMVTHNPELAEKYSSRIVNLKDGKIVNDSDAYNPSHVDLEKMQTQDTVKKSKTSMSLLTALQLSFSNLMGKKGRTFLTSFAGSIGIIGIALILALSNGVQHSIDVADSTQNSFSLQISSMRNSNDIRPDLSTFDAAGQQKLAINATNSKKLAVSGANDLQSLLTYLNSNPENFKDKVSDYECSYNADMMIYDSDSSQTKQLYPDNFINKLNQSSYGSNTASGSVDDTLSGKTFSISANYFKALIGNESSYKNDAEILAGKWPENSNECILTVGETGAIDDTLMYLLGLRDSSELKTAIENYNNNEKVNLPNSYEPIAFDTIMAKSFKVVVPSSLYVKNASGGWKLNNMDSAFMQEKIANGKDLKLVGIIQTNKLQQGIYFPHSLSIDSINLSAQSDIVKEQLANPAVDVLSGKSFEELKKAADGIVNVNNAPTDNSSIGLDALGGLLSSSSINYSFDDVMKVINSALDENTAKKIVGVMLSDNNLNSAMADVMADAAIQYARSGEQDPHWYFHGKGKEYVTKAIESTGQAVTPALINQYREIMVNVCSQIYSTMFTLVAEKLASQSIESLGQITSSKNLSNIIDFNMTDENLGKIADGLTGARTFDRNLSEFGYADLTNPKDITLYTDTKEKKEQAKTIIDNYNNTMQNSRQPEKIITYTDTDEVSKNMITGITNMISGALTAFVSVSLIVSTFMIGIITYISVLERRREIGILRAIGARKRDIFNVFNAETFIIGLFAGVMGIVITLLISLPANAIIKLATHQDTDMLVLPISSAIILIVVSVVLTFIAGLFPSSNASKKDPVEAING